MRVVLALIIGVLLLSGCEKREGINQTSTGEVQLVYKSGDKWIYEKYSPEQYIKLIRQGMRAIGEEPMLREEA